MEQSYEEYIRTRKPKDNKTAELGTWFGGLKAQNATSSLAGKSSTCEHPSGPTTKQSENENEYAEEGGATPRGSGNVKDSASSQSESVLKSKKSDYESDYSAMNPETKIDERWRPYHGDPNVSEPTLSREEFDRYRVLAEEQMKHLRQERDYLRKAYLVKCANLRKEVEKREAREPDRARNEAHERRTQFPKRSASREEDISTVRSTDVIGEVDVFGGSSSRSVQKATEVVRKAREMRIRILLQRAAIAATVNQWTPVEKRASEALRLVGRLAKPAVEAKCRFWYGIARYHQGDIVEAAESFEQSKACRSENSQDWACPFHRAEYEEMNPDKWLKHCESLIAHNTNIEDSVSSVEDESYEAPEDVMRAIDPDVQWYAVPRSETEIVNWMEGVLGSDTDSQSDDSAMLLEKAQEVQEKLEELETPQGSTGSQTLEDELAGCVIVEDSSSNEELGQWRNVEEELGAWEDTQYEQRGGRELEVNRSSNRSAIAEQKSKKLGG